MEYIKVAWRSIGACFLIITQHFNKHQLSPSSSSSSAAAAAAAAAAASSSSRTQTADASTPASETTARCYQIGLALAILPQRTRGRDWNAERNAEGGRGGQPAEPGRTDLSCAGL